MSLRLVLLFLLPLVFGDLACSGSDTCSDDEYRICVSGECLCGKRCTDDAQCLAGQKCAKNISDERACVAEAFVNSAAPRCASGQAPTVGLCGDSSCTCADPCGTHDECRSKCCVAGYCALPCVCAEPSIETYVCGPPGSGDGDE